jgi:hypothetical protein
MDMFKFWELGTVSVHCKNYKNQPVKIIQSIQGNRLVYQRNESLFSHQDCIELNPFISVGCKKSHSTTPMPKIGDSDLL